VSADLEKPPGKTGDKNGCPDTPDESKPLPEPNAKQEQPPQEPEPPQKNGRRFVRPTDDELKLMAAKIGLPESERLKFAAYYDANGWKVGRNPMKSPSAAMVGWKVRWQERNGVGVKQQTWHDEEAADLIAFAARMEKGK
jgi:hypothetical protein